MDQGPSQYLPTSAVAEQLGVSHKTVIGWIKDGKLGAIQPGGPRGRYRIPAAEFDRLKAGRAA